MSWHYLQELVEGSSAESSRASGPSAPWKKSPTAERCSSDVNGTVCYPCSQSGTTSGPSMADPGVASWMSLQRGSPVPPTARPASGAGPRTSETSGPTPSESYAKWDRGTRFWKTCRTFWPMTISAKSSDRWGRQGSMRSGTLYPRRKSVHRISGKGSGLLPTPRVSRGQYQRRRGVIYPTLAGIAENPESFPTPLSRDHKGAVHPERRTRDGKQRTVGDRALPDVVGGRLNPRWVEWLLGWPIGWVSLEVLERARFREWRRKHGGD